ncbi:MAG: ribosomal protein S18-alanine N-acetyltransferase [Steroidobacterales bacterium]
MSSVKQTEVFPSVEIREMHDLDIPVVVSIERAGYQFPWSEGIFRDCLRVGYICRVIDVGGALAGYGIMSVGAGEAHILNVCIGDEYRCRGLGRNLMLHLMQRARALGMDEAFLEVRPSNLVASRLYHSLGFEQIGVRRGYYQAPMGREDASVLRCVLAANSN